MGDTTTSDSGGTMRRWEGGDPAPRIDAHALEHVRVTTPGGWRRAGTGPFMEEGSELVWRYGLGAEAMRVVRDDERGLVGWLAEGSQRVAMAPADGSSIRDHDLVTRFTMPRAPRQSVWRSGGVLRIAPTGRPWSIWYFWEDDGSFAGHYVNLELPHLRTTHEPTWTSSRDLVLDVWIDATGTWLKDEDELEAAVTAGRLSIEDTQTVRAWAAAAHHELVTERSWPMSEAWEDWRPPVEWTEPALLPAALWDGAEPA